MIHNPSRSRSSMFATSSMVKMAMLAAIGMILMLLDSPPPLPQFPAVDLSDVPPLSSASAWGLRQG